MNIENEYKKGGYHKTRKYQKLLDQAWNKADSSKDRILISSYFEAITQQDRVDGLDVAFQVLNQGKVTKAPPFRYKPDKKR